MKAFLIRHASSAHQGPDAPLTDTGYAQAEKLARHLAKLNIGALFSSPFRRAQETIAPYATLSNQTVIVLDDLRERTLSASPLPDWKDHIARSFADPNYAPEGGESHVDLRRRAAIAFEKIAESDHPLPAFVTHGGLTAAVFSAANPSFGFEDWQSLRNPDLFAVALQERQVMAFERIELEELL